MIRMKKIEEKIIFQKIKNNKVQFIVMRVKDKQTLKIILIKLNWRKVVWILQTDLWIYLFLRVKKSIQLISVSLLEYKNPHNKIPKKEITFIKKMKILHQIKIMNRLFQVSLTNKNHKKEIIITPKNNL